jgi:sugar phosphate isomerase/epimerase
MTFKLAAITDEIDEDLDNALDVMSEYDITAAEIRSVGGKNISTMTDPEISEVRSILDKYGAHAIGVASPFFKTDLPGLSAESAAGALHGAAQVGFDDQITLLRKCIGAAKTLGATMVRTFTFWSRVPLTEEIEEWIVDAYQLPAKIASDEGITLIIENEHGCFAGTGAEAARIVSRINLPSVKIVWDPGNAIFAGEQAFPVGYEACKPYIAHVHVKDAKPVGPDGKTQWVVVGGGIVNWPAQLAALKADNYTGYLSLETHYASGKGKEASSRECLDELMKLLKGV